MTSSKQTSSIDLHIHSHFSDGCLSPGEIVRTAAKKGLSAVALTDHDTTAGLQKFIQHSENLDIIAVPGIEFSISGCEGISDIDMLGYFPDINLLGPITEVCKKIKTAREKRLDKMISVFNKDTIVINKKDVLKNNSNFFSVGRKHLAEAVQKNNPQKFKTTQSVFDEYLGNGCKADLPIEQELLMRDAIELIHSCSGKAVLAHPGVSNSFPPDKKIGYKLIDYAISQGVDGIEGYYVYYKNRPYKKAKMSLDESNALCEEYIRHIKNNGKIVTAGSDSHGNNNIDIGENAGSLELIKELFK